MDDDSPRSSEPLEPLSPPPPPLLALTLLSSLLLSTPSPRPHRFPLLCPPPFLSSYPDGQRLRGRCVQRRPGDSGGVRQHFQDPDGEEEGEGSFTTDKSEGEEEGEGSFTTDKSEGEEEGGTPMTDNLRVRRRGDVGRGLLDFSTHSSFLTHSLTNPPLIFSLTHLLLLPIRCASQPAPAPLTLTTT